MSVGAPRLIQAVSPVRNGISIKRDCFLFDRPVLGVIDVIGEKEEGMGLRVFRSLLCRLVVVKRVYAQ